MKNLLIATLLGSTAVAGSALAQEAAQPTDPAVQTETVPVAPAPELEGDGQTAAGGATQGGFVTWQEQDQMIASNLMGASVRGAEDEVIGNVDDLLLDRDGRITAVVVGVGGFLGLGERNVAISAEQLEFVLAQDAGALGGTAAGAGATGGTSGQDAATISTGVGAVGGTAGQEPAASGTVADAGADGSTAGQGATALPGNGGEGTATANMMENDAADPGGTAARDTGETNVIPTGETVAMDAEGNATGMGGQAGATNAGGTGATNGGLGWTGSVIDHIKVNFTREQLEAAPPFETIE